MDEYPSVPTSIAERYKVGRTLGDGNFAVVRECVERSTGREYALKIISKDKCRGKVGLPVQLLTEIIRPPCLVSFSATKLISLYTVGSLLLDSVSLFSSSVNRWCYKTELLGLELVVYATSIH